MDRTRYILGPDGYLYGTGGFLCVNGEPVRMDALDAQIQVAMVRSLAQTALNCLDSNESDGPPTPETIGRRIAQN